MPTAGEVVALLGPNGAGKTTTVETLEGFRRPDAGSVRVLGLDPYADHARLMAQVGVFLQRGGIYPMMSARRAIHLFAAYYDDARDPEELIDLVGLRAVAGTAYKRLSGGEQQRLALALGAGRQPPRGPPRRADRRRRPGRPHRRPGRHRRSARRRRERPAHEPRARRGAAPGRPRRHHRPRQGRRRRAPRGDPGGLRGAPLLRRARPRGDELAQRLGAAGERGTARRVPRLGGSRYRRSWRLSRPGSPNATCSWATFEPTARGSRTSSCG